MENNYFDPHAFPHHHTCGCYSCNRSFDQRGSEDGSEETIILYDNLNLSTTKEIRSNDAVEN